MKKYHFMSLKTGELASNLRGVLKISLHNLMHYHFIDKWKYSRAGF